MSSEAPEEKGRQSSSRILLLLLGAAVVVGAVMFWLGMKALDMSGVAMEHNKLLKQKTQTCSDRGRLDECAKVMKMIEETEKAMAAGERKEGASRP